MSQIDATEARLNTHELLCSERYKGIEVRMDNIEQRMDSISQDVKELKEATAKSTGEIKNMLTNAKDEKFKVMITATATIIVSLLAMLGYVITHLK